MDTLENSINTRLPANSPSVRPPEEYSSLLGLAMGGEMRGPTISSLLDNTV